MARGEGTSRDGQQHEAAGPAGPAGAARRRRFRRPLRWALIAVVGLVLLAWASPYLASTSPVTAWILSLVNARIPGRIDLEDLSLRWLGPSRVRGLGVWDQAGREVLRAREVRWSEGVWQALLGRGDLGEVVASLGRATLIVEDDGAVSLVKALRPSRPRARRARGLPVSDGRVRLEGFSLAVVRSDGRRLDLPVVGGHVSLERGRTLRGEFTARLAGGRMWGRLILEELVPEPAGTLRVRTEAPLDVRPLASFLAGADVRGRLGVDIDGAVSPERVELNAATSLTGLEAPWGGAQPAKGVDVRLAGHVSVTSEDVSAGVNLTGEVGSAEADFRIAPSGRSLRLSPGRLLAAVLGEGQVLLPDLTLRAGGEVNLAVLGEAVPALLKIRPGVRIRSGKLTFEEVLVRGGDSPSIRGRFELTDVQAWRAGREIRLEPVLADLRARLDAEQGLLVKQARLRSGFCRADLAGSPAAMSLRLQADLGGLHRQLDRLVDLEALLGVTGLALGGTVRADLSLARPRAGRADIRLRADLTGLDYADGRRRMSAARVRIRQGARVTFARAGVERLEFSDSSIDIDGRLRASLTGWYAPPTGTIRAEVDLKRAAVSHLLEASGALTSEQARRYGGHLRAKVALSRTTAHAPLEADADGALVAASLDGRLRALDRDTGNVVWEVDTRLNDVDSYTITGAPRVVNGKVIIGNGGAEMSVRGYVTAYDAAILTACRDKHILCYTLQPELFHHMEGESLIAS